MTRQLTTSSASTQCAAAQLYKDGTVPRLLHKTSVIRAANRHAALLETDLRYLRGLPRKDLSSATKTKRLAFAQANLKKKLEAGAVH